MLSLPGIQFSIEITEAIEQILFSYPNYFPVGSLQIEDAKDRNQVITALMEEDLLQVHTNFLTQRNCKSYWTLLLSTEVRIKLNKITKFTC